jgi:hypothetical protein
MRFERVNGIKACKTRRVLRDRQRRCRLNQLFKCKKLKFEQLSRSIKFRFGLHIMEPALALPASQSFEQQEQALPASFDFETTFQIIYGLRVTNAINSIRKIVSKNEAMKDEISHDIFNCNGGFLDALCEKREFSPAEFDKLLEILTCLHIRGTNLNDLQIDQILEFMDQEKYPRIHTEECFDTLTNLLDGHIQFDPEINVHQLISRSLLHMCPDVDKLLDIVVWFGDEKKDIRYILENEQTLFIDLMTTGFSGFHNPNCESDVLTAFPLKIGNMQFRLHLRCSGKLEKQAYFHQNQLDEIIAVYKLIEIAIKKEDAKNLKESDMQSNIKQ